MLCCAYLVSHVQIKGLKDYIKYLKTVPAQIMYSVICTINSATA